MPKLKFNPEEMKSALNSARLVKPSSKDITLRIRGKSLHIISQDLRSRSVSIIRAIDSDFDDNYSSEDYYLSLDRHSILEANLNSVAISETDKGLSIKYEDGPNIRQAHVRKRADNARRNRVGEVIFPENGHDLNSKDFCKLLEFVGCSALVGDTKTDQDMKMNQVHFFKEESCAYSNARTYASIAFMPGIPFNISIVSSDLPQIRAFCSKIDDDVSIHFDEHRIYFFNKSKTRLLTCTQVKTSRPPLTIYSENLYNTEILCEYETLNESINWAITSIEGTNKVGLKSINNSGSIFIDLIGPTGQISRFPSVFVKGSNLLVDVHIDKLSQIVRHVGDNVIIKTDHPILRDTIEVCNKPDSRVRVRHFLKCMRVSV